MEIIIYKFEIWSTLHKRESLSNHVLKDIDEFSLAFDSAVLWGPASAIFPFKRLELRCILLFIRFSYIMVKLLGMIKIWHISLTPHPVFNNVSFLSYPASPTPYHLKVYVTCVSSLNLTFSFAGCLGHFSHFV